MASKVNPTYDEIRRQIAAVERAVLTFQAGVVRSSGTDAADGTNQAIILAARLSTVWKRLGESMTPRSRRAAQPVRG